MKYFVVGKFRADEFRICVRNDKLVHVPLGDPQTNFFSAPHFAVHPDRRDAYDGVFSTYETAVCIMMAASSKLKLVDLHIEGHNDG